MKDTQKGTNATIEKQQQLIVFRLGNEEYGLPIEQIKEVVLTPPVTRIPLMPNHIKGVANIRGSILAIVDLEEKLGLQTHDEAANTKRHYALVIESKDYHMAILAREVPNTLSVPESAIEQSPNLIYDNSPEKGYIKGIIKLDERLVILIDIFKIMNTDLAELGKLTKE
jgi:purine-binding chemotaxis protein CheW